MGRYLIVLLLACLPIPAVAVSASDSDDWTIAEINPIEQIYIGQGKADGKTELVLELTEIHYMENQRRYPCTLVNGRIVWVQERNWNWPWMRVMVDLQGSEEIIAYSGTVKAPDRIDCFDEIGLWKAYLKSPHKPFKAKLSELPKWDEDKRVSMLGGRPYHGQQKWWMWNDSSVKPKDISAVVKTVRDPTTGDEDRYYLVRALSRSSYVPEVMGTLADIATNPKEETGTREWAAMGLFRYRLCMAIDEREVLRQKLRQALHAEKEKLPYPLTKLLIDWGDADLQMEVLGEKLRGSELEIDVLRRISSRDKAIERLVEIYDHADALTTPSGRYWRGTIANALVARRDKRGIDICLENLSVKEPLPPRDNTPQAQDQNLALFRQSRYNTFVYIADVFDDYFDLPREGALDYPKLEEAILEMVDWWKKHREDFNLEDALSETVPERQPGKVLTRRQARVLAAKLANDALAEREPIRINNPCGEAEIHPESFSDIRLEEGRWVLKTVRNLMQEIVVDFRMDGLDEEVTINRVTSPFE